MKNNILIIVIIFLIVVSCSKEESNYIAYNPTLVNFEKPSNFPDIIYNLDNNPLTEEGFELGKKLFYEGKLSADGTVPCAFCHVQSFAFTHHGHNLSHGINDGVGTRNSPPIQNLAFLTSFMWDGSVSHLDLQPILPINSKVEMGETLPNVVSKLKADETYQKLFKQAFENGEINSENVLKALSQFMLQVVTSNSKYDKFVREEEGITLSESEHKGMLLFKDKCSICHSTDLFTNQSFENNGLPINTRLQDSGRYRITFKTTDWYKFKVPSLRNVEHTYPYMHDGRFETLEAVLDFYDHGMVDNGNVSPLLLRTDGTYGITIQDDEKESLIAFLKTLTDNEFLNDKRFSEY